MLPVAAFCYDFTYGSLAYNILSAGDQTVEVTVGDSAYKGDIVIPATVEYKNRTMTVLGIGKNAFENNYSITSISFPQSTAFRYIGHGAFENCKGITNIEIPNNIDSIAEYAFQGCSNLESIKLPDSLKILYKYSLSMLPKLKNITLPKSLTTIGWYVFWKDAALTDIVIPASVVEIDMDAFTGCTGLSTLTLEDGEKTLYKYAITAAKEFQYVKTLYLGRNVKPDGYYWKQDYQIANVENLTVGKNVNDITWVTTTNLSNVTLHAVTPPKTNTFSEKQYTDLTIKVPQEAIDAYKAADVWKNFWNIEGISTGIKQVTLSSGGKESYYYLNGSKAKSDSKGVIIHRTEDGKVIKEIRK